MSRLAIRWVMLSAWIASACCGSLCAQRRLDRPYQCGFVLPTQAAIRAVYGPELAVLDLQPGEVIADVGGSNGYRMAMFATLYDSLHFIVQDIDTQCLNAPEMERVIAWYTRVKGKQMSCTFERVLGTTTESLLPQAACDKVIVTAAYHHFDQPAAMLADLAAKLKPGGKIYLIENVVRRHGQRRRRLCDDVLMTEAELRMAFEAQGCKVEAVHSLGRWWTKMFVLRPR